MHKFLSINNISSDLILEDKKTNKLSIAMQTVSEVDVNVCTINGDLEHSFDKEATYGQFTIFGDLSDEHMLFTDTIANAITLNTCTNLTAVACYSKDNIPDVINSFTHYIKPVACVDHMGLDDLINFEDNIYNNTNAKIVMCDNKSSTFVRMRKKGNDISVLKAVKVAIDAIKESQTSKKFTFNRIDYNSQAKQVNWLVKNYIEEKSVNILYGPSGQYKSFALMQMLTDIATGSECFNQITKKTVCVYACGEGQSGIENRAKAIASKNNITETPDVFMMPELFNMVNEGEVCSAIEYLKEFKEHMGVDSLFIALDTFKRYSGDCDENDATGMQLFANSCDRFKNELNSTIIAVHHTPKSSPREMRGSGALLGSLEGAINVLTPKNKDGEKYGYIEINVVKQKNSFECDPLFFTPEVVKLGVDDDGDDITSVILNGLTEEDAADMKLQAEAGDTKSYKKNEKYSAKAKAIVNKSKIKRSVENIMNSQKQYAELERLNAKDSIVNHVRLNDNKIELSSVKQYCELNGVDLLEAKQAIKELQEEKKININKTTLTLP